MGKLQRLTARFDEMGRYAMEELGYKGGKKGKRRFPFGF